MPVISISDSSRRTPLTSAVGDLTGTFNIARPLNRLVDSFDVWCKRLLDSGLLVQIESSDGKPAFGLKAAYRLCIRPVVARRLVARYNPRREIGGVLAARPVRKGGVWELDVTKSFVLRNRSDKPEESYWANPEEKMEAVRNCFEGTSAGTRYLPIEFHSHPSDRQDMEEGQYSFFREYFNLETSTQDKSASGWAWTYGRYRLWFPRILVSRLHDELFIGVYGGGSAPSNFNEFMVKIVGQAGVSFLDFGLEWAEDNIWKKVLVGAGVAAYTIAAAISMIAPGGLQSLALTLLKAREKSGANTYFGFTNGEALTIDIPAPEKPKSRIQ